MIYTYSYFMVHFEGQDLKFLLEFDYLSNSLKVLCFYSVPLDPLPFTGSSVVSNTETDWNA